MSDRTAIVNGLKLDEKTGNIRIGRGATGSFTATLGVDAGAIDTDTDIVLFIVTTVKKSHTVIGRVNGITVGGREDEVCVLRKKFDIDVDDDTVSVLISVTNADTKGIDVGEYVWNALIITDPSYDDDGNIVIGDTDSVAPFYIDGERPTFSVEEVGCVV